MTLNCAQLILYDKFARLYFPQFALEMLFPNRRALELPQQTVFYWWGNISCVWDI